MFTRWRNKSGASICRYDVTNEDEDENEIFIVVVVAVVVVDDVDRILDFCEEYDEDGVKE